MKKFIFLFFIFIFSISYADEFLPFSGEKIKVSEEDLIPHLNLPENKNSENYSETYSFVFKLNNGYGAYIQFIISNFGIGDEHGAVRAHLGIPEGKHFSTTTEFKKGEWGFWTKKFYVKMGDNIIEGDLKKIKIMVKNNEFEAEYIFKNLAEPWRPGNGKTFYGSSKAYYDFKILMPVSEIKGKVRVIGEERYREVSGYGYCDHTFTNIAMHKQAKRWIRIRAINPKETLILTEFHAPTKYQEKKSKFLVFFIDGKLKFESLDFELFPKKFNSDNKTGYNVPVVLELRGSNFLGAIKVVKSTGREDYLEDLNPVFRSIVSKIAKPVMFYFDAKYAFELSEKSGKQTFNGDARYYYLQVTK